MKKMLTIIGAAGLVATTGNTLVACSWFDKYDKNADAFLQLNTYEIHLAKKNDESVTIEVLDYEKKTEQLEKEIRERIKGEYQLTIDAKFYHVSGITSIECKDSIRDTNGIKSYVIQVSSLDVRGKSTWMIDLHISLKSGTLSLNWNNRKPVYFDVIID